MIEDFGLFISCEHGGNQVPENYAQLFAGQQTVLDSHRGYDIGILSFARKLASRFDAPFLTATVTRLLVDLNRSTGNRTLFSEWTRPLPEPERQHILQRYHQPYWKAATEIVAGIVASGRRALHLSVHSFTPELHGRIRNTDLGLLYDPRRPGEKSLCLQWQQTLSLRCPDLRVRRNYPYRGNSDALVTALRRQFLPNDYLGIELEFNQRLILESPKKWEKLQEKLIDLLADW